jgi:hypothetical protein
MEAAATDYSRRIGAWARNTSAGDYAAAGAGSLAALQRACRREFLAHLARALCLSPERTLADRDASPDDTLDAAHATAAELRPNIDNWTDQKTAQRLLARASCRSDAAAAAAETNRVPLRVPLPAPVEAPVTQSTVPIQASLFDIAA